MMKITLLLVGLIALTVIATWQWQVAGRTTGPTFKAEEIDRILNK